MLAATNTITTRPTLRIPLIFNERAREKRDPWMLTCLSREAWNLPPHNTNASESAHANINLDEKSLPCFQLS